LQRCWLPDDFGQDPELPVGVQALGMRSIAFSRLPGIPPQGSSIQDPQLKNQLVSDGWIFSGPRLTMPPRYVPTGCPGWCRATTRALAAQSLGCAGQNHQGDLDVS
jgi:hypothetical protein